MRTRKYWLVLSKDQTKNDLEFISWYSVRQDQHVNLFFQSLVNFWSIKVCTRFTSMVNRPNWVQWDKTWVRWINTFDTLRTRIHYLCVCVLTPERVPSDQKIFVFCLHQSLYKWQNINFTTSLWQNAQTSWKSVKSQNQNCPP